MKIKHVKTGYIKEYPEHSTSIKTLLKSKSWKLVKEEKPDEDKPLEEMTKAELTALAKEKEIEKYSSMNKVELLEALK